MLDCPGLGTLGLIRGASMRILIRGRHLLPAEGRGVSVILPNGQHAPHILVITPCLLAGLAHGSVMSAEQSPSYLSPARSQDQPLRASAGKLNPDTVSWGPVPTLHFGGTKPRAHLPP